MQSIVPTSALPAPDPSGAGTNDFTPGVFLGPYRIVGELASGGMATVHMGLAAGRAGVHRIVAVKQLHPHLAGDENHRRMFLDEARIASQIRHPNVCEVFDFGEHDSTPYLVMEYLVGEPISALWKALPRTSSESDRRRRATFAIRIIADACEALHAAHELRSVEGNPLHVVHRDVSPDNLVVTYDGVVKLCDFGIAIAEQQEHSTDEGMLKGKFAYIPPEVLRGQRPDRRSDIYSLGVVLWELATAERLFRRESALETIQAVGDGLVPSPSDLIGLAPELDEIVFRALAADPAERYPDARAFGKALSGALAAAGQQVGIAEIAEWMEELFPDGHARKRRMVELMAILYTPSPAAPRTPRPSIADEAEALTIAMERRSSVPSVALASPLPPVTVMRPDPKWRRLVTAFALGALIGPGLFSPTKQASGEVASQVSIAPGAARAFRGVRPAAAVDLGSGDPGTWSLEPARETSILCDGTQGTVAITEGRDASQELGLRADASRETAPSRAAHQRIPPFLSPPPPPDQPLLLAPEFAVYAPARLARPEFHASGSRWFGDTRRYDGNTRRYDGSTRRYDGAATRSRVRTASADFPPAY